MSQQQTYDYSRGYGAQLADPIKRAGVALGQVAGMDSLNAENTKQGKGMIIGYWIFIVIIFIYMIVLAIIYYNNYTKYTWNEERRVYTYGNSDGTIEEISGELLEEQDLVTWNIHKTVMNGLLIVAGIYAVIIFVFLGTGNGIFDGKCVHGATQLGWFIVLCIIWFIVNMVWDIKNSVFTLKQSETTTESFCGMAETFCGSVSEGFANVSKKLRRF